MSLSERSRQVSPRMGGLSLVALVLGTWVAATVLVLGVAAETAVGPVVLTLSNTHGVHLGDLAAAALAYGGAILVTAWAVESYRRR